MIMSFSKLVKIISLAALFAVTTAQASVELISSETRLLPLLHVDDMAAVHTQAKEILSKCKLPECKIVSLGPTNTLVDSFLRYYLKGDADRAIHYVPLRHLFAINLPAGIQRSLPEPAPDLKRVVIVRTLEKGLSIDSFARRAKEYFGEGGAPYAIEGNFSVAGTETEEPINLRNFSWPYEIKKLPNSTVISGSYRKIDTAFYRFHPITYVPSDFWRAHSTDPRVVDFKKRVARSVGADTSVGHSIFLRTDAVRKAWVTALGENAFATYETYSRLKSLLPYGDARDTYIYEFKALENQLFTEIQYRENRDYKVLDQAVRLFIEDPELFAQKQCAARLLN